MPRLLAVADTDSYLKWSAATLDGLPSGWEATQLVVENPVMPSATQIRAASRRPVGVASLAAMLDRVRRDRPDVVLLACTGPVVSALSAQRVFSAPGRPVVVTGLPGISVPATRRAVASRARCDLFLLHSHRELAEFTRLAAELGSDLTFGLARLPFLPSGSPAAAVDAGTNGNLLGPVIFAAQAKVPAVREQRLEILRALAETGVAVVKLRAVRDERQTHRETWSYPALWEELVGHGLVRGDEVRFIGGSMHEALDGAAGLATVSSTAALEAMALGLPVLVLSDFGVSAELVNQVFEDSGCLGTLSDLTAGRLPHPDPGWLAANYFHPAPENDWLVRLDRLLGLRELGLLRRPRPVRVPLPLRIRRQVRLMLPPGTWSRLRTIRAAVRPSSWSTSRGMAAERSGTVRP
jgi:hypothetical protein